MSLPLICRSFLLLAALAVATPSSIAIAETLPARTSEVPKTTDGVPHIQLGVRPKPAILARLLRRVSKIPGVYIRDTVISLPGAKGFWVEDGLELARPDVIVGGREFAHMHPDGSLHATLPPELAAEASKLGWATPHPWAKRRRGWEGFVMVFTPGSDEELDLVFKLVLASYNFVTGNNLTAIEG